MNINKYLKKEITNSRMISPTDFGFENSENISIEKSVFYSSGREAVVGLIRALGLNKKNTVLLPDFCPEGIVDPFKKNSINIIYYPIDRELRPIIERLFEIINKEKPKICILIHYFGIIQEEKNIIRICREKGVLIIEDFAHVLFSNKSNYGLNSDFCLFSFDKVLPVPDGSELRINNDILSTNKFIYSKSNKRNLYVILKILNLIVTRLTQLAPPFIVWRRAAYLFHKIDTYRLLMDYYIEHQCKMSYVARLILRKLKIKKIISIRAKYELIYKNNLDEEVFIAFRGFSPAHSFCRMGYPVKVEMRESLVNYLYENGISGVYFKNKWCFADLDDPSHTYCSEILDSNFLFPTSSSLTESDIYYVVNVANKWASKEFKKQN